MRIRTFLLFLITALNSCIEITQDFGGIYKIHGVVHNFNQESKYKTISIAVFDIFNKERTKSIVIDKTGEFRFEHNTPCVKDLMLVYGRSHTAILISPGDSIYLDIVVDTNLVKSDTDKSNSVKFIFSNNEIGQTNKIVNQFLEESKFLGSLDKIIVKSTPAEFIEYLKKEEEESIAELDSFIRKNESTEMFYSWAKDLIKYKSWHSKFRYSWYHPYVNNTNSSNFQLPKDFFSFLDSYNMNEKSVISHTHSKFLEKYYNYVQLNPSDLLRKFNSRYSNFDSITIKMIDFNTSGFTRDLFLSKYYFEILEDETLEEFETIYNADNLHNQYFKNEIEKEYKSKKSNDSITLISLKSGITTGVIDKLISEHKNKVLYIDFWAPWCGSCIQEIPNSKKLQEVYKEKDVAFIYLAAKCDKNMWEAAKENFQMTGDHYLLSLDEFQYLSGKLGFSGLPHYLLIDRNGNIDNKDAARPNNTEKIIKDINKLLKNEP